MTTTRKIRHSGLERPYNALQIITWILYPILVTNFLVLNSAILVDYDAWIGSLVTAIFLAFAGISLYFGYLTCVTDPIDPRLECFLKNLNSDGHNNVNDANNNDNDPEEFKHCWVCQTTVNPQSLHCKYCQKCVARFDHHCQWLNTCVGERNYKLFFRTVVSTFLFVGVHFFVNLFLLIGYFVELDDGRLKQSVDDLYNENNNGNSINLAVITLVMIFCVVTGAALCLIVQLLLFHLSLQRPGITTYGYIVGYSARQTEKRKMKASINTNRAKAMALAQQKGEPTLMLRLGKVCIPCDPIRNELRDQKNGDKQTREVEATRKSSTKDDNENDVAINDEKKDFLEEINLTNENNYLNNKV